MAISRDGFREFAQHLEVPKQAIDLALTLVFNVSDPDEYLMQVACDWTHWHREDIQRWIDTNSLFGRLSLALHEKGFSNYEIDKLYHAAYVYARRWVTIDIGYILNRLVFLSEEMNFDELMEELGK